MITEQDLRQAIAECQGNRNPSASTCIKLAAYYTILNQLEGIPAGDVLKKEQYSFENRPKIKFTDTEFSQIVERKGLDTCFPVLDEIMSALLVCNPKLYNNAIQRLADI